MLSFRVIFEVKMRTHWRDADPAGIVYFANHFTFIEQAEEELFRVRGGNRQELLERHKVWMPRVEAFSKYVRPIKIGTTIRVRLSPHLKGLKTIRYEFEILEDVPVEYHVIAHYRKNGCWGSISNSNYAGLRFRSPIYRTLRELALSYFEHYYNLDGEKTLRAYSRPVNLSRFDKIGWMTAEDDLWSIPEYLVEVKHTPIAEITRRVYVDKRLYKAGLVGRAD